MVVGDPLTQAVAALQAQAAQAAAMAQVQADWAASDPASPAYVANKPPPRSQAAMTRALNAAFQVHAGRDATVGYSVTIACTLSLTAGQSGSVVLEYADDAGFAANVVGVCQVSNGNTGTLAVGLNLTQTVTLRLVGTIPAGKWARMRTVNAVGTPTYSYAGGNELLM